MRAIAFQKRLVFKLFLFCVSSDVAMLPSLDGNASARSRPARRRVNRVEIIFGGDAVSGIATSDLRESARTSNGENRRVRVVKTRRLKRRSPVVDRASRDAML